jgi:hypothetical protein
MIKYAKTVLCNENPNEEKFVKEKQKDYYAENISKL